MSEAECIPPGTPPDAPPKSPTPPLPSAPPKSPESPASPNSPTPQDASSGGMNLANFGGTSCSAQEGRAVPQLDISAAEKQSEEEKNQDEEACRIYESGQAFEYMTNTCLKLHVDDENIIRALILSYAGTFIANNELGINIRISGEAGIGKTHVANTVAKIVPPDYMLAARFSDKALLYMCEDLKPGSVIYYDDQALSEQAAEIMKAQTSDINKPFIYHTVANGKHEPLIFPPLCVRWFVLCNSTGDEQTADRELSFFVDNSFAHQQRVKKLKAFLSMNPSVQRDTTAVDTARRIWKYIPRGTIVQIPFADRIESDGSEPLRNLALFESLIRASAVLHAPVRERTAEGYVVASEEDFEIAAKIMNPILKGVQGSQKHKLTKNQERILTEFLEPKESSYYLFKDIRDALNLSEAQLSQAVNGRYDTTHHSDGLLKIPGIAARQDKDGIKYLEWDAESYRRWNGSKAYFILRPVSEESESEEPVSEKKGKVIMGLHR